MPRYILIFLFLSCMIVAETASAFRRHGIYIGDGFGSCEQYRNRSGEYTRMGMALSFTGPLFVTYRYAFSNTVSAGLTAGLDNTGGRITRRRDDRSRYHSTLPSGTLGSYERKSRTIAAEFRVKYYSNEWGSFYSYVGAGYTFSDVTLVYDRDVYEEVSKRKPDVLPPVNPMVVNDDRVAHQVTLLGYRTADPLALFAEVGFGYKGLLHLGLSYEF